MCIIYFYTLRYLYICTYSIFEMVNDKQEAATAGAFIEIYNGWIVNVSER